MNLTDFNKLYDSTYKCYAVYAGQDRTIERGLIIDSPSLSSVSSGTPLININNFHTTLPISEITVIIVTSMRWSKPHA